ncbi:MAG: YihY/virulence factor BrkB family protein [Armatimonadota bacterium]|jgi:membrane protein
MRLRDNVTFMREVWQNFAGRNGLLLAAAVSFYTFLSLFPLSLVAVGILGYVLRSPQHAEELITHFAGKVVIGSVTMDMVTSVLHGRDAATGIGLALSLWSGMAATLTMEQAVNLVWSAPLRRNYFKRRGLALLILLIVGLLITISFGITALLQTLRRVSPGFISSTPVLWQLLGHVVAAVASVILFTLIYKIMPNAQVRWRNALAGGVFAGLLWEAAKQIFTIYVVHFASYSRVYGPLAGVILLLVWINYSSAIAVFGAGFASHWRAVHENGQAH